MKIILANILTLSAIWLMLSGIPDDILWISFAIITPVVSLYLALFMGTARYINQFNIKALLYPIYIIKEILIASFQVAMIVWRRNPFTQQVIAPVKSIQKTKAGIVTYANSITLTPGTITVNLDKNNLLVHALDVSIMEDLQSGQMDREIKKIIKSNQ